MSLIRAVFRSALAVAVNSEKFKVSNPTARAAISLACSDPLSLRDSLIPEGPLTAVT